MSNDPRCAKCGHPRSNHPYRHMFVGASRDDAIKNQADLIEELEAKLEMVTTELKVLTDMSTFMQSSACYDKRRYQSMITDTVWSQWSKQLKFAKSALATLKGQDDE